MAYQEPNRWILRNSADVSSRKMTEVLSWRSCLSKTVRRSKFQEELPLLRQYVGTKLPFTTQKLDSSILAEPRFILNEDLNHTGGPQDLTMPGDKFFWLNGCKRKLSQKQVLVSTWQLQQLQPFNVECTIYMGEEDVKRQALNVFRMELLGAKVEAVTRFARARGCC